MKKEDFPAEMQELMTDEGRRRVFMTAKSAKVLRRYLHAALLLVAYSNATTIELDALLMKVQEKDGALIDEILKELADERTRKDRESVRPVVPEEAVGTSDSHLAASGIATHLPGLDGIMPCTT